MSPCVCKLTGGPWFQDYVQGKQWRDAELADDVKENSKAAEWKQG